MIAARPPLLAELFEVVEAETPYGGRSQTYDLIGSAWIRPGAARRRDRSEASAATIVETLTAEGRADARLVAGRMLRFGGTDWRIAASERFRGRVILNLEKMR